MVEPFAQLLGATKIGADTLIGAHSTLIDSTVGDNATIRHSYLTGARVDDGATVGPFAYLRPDAHLHPKAKAGTFVEIKNSEIGAGAKVPHLSYIGDADIGEGTNIGAGNITANYDGKNKHRTTIGANVRSSVHTAYVAPVTVGDEAYTAAGTVVTDDVPPKALAHLARPPEEHRGLRGPQEVNASSVGRTLPSPVSALDPRTGIAHLGSSLAVEYDKRLMVVSGPRQPRSRRPDLGEARRLAGRRHAPDLLQRRGLLPLRGVDPRGGPVHRAADVRQPRDRDHGQRRADGAAADGRRRSRRVGAPRDRRHPVVRLLAAGQEVARP